MAMEGGDSLSPVRGTSKSGVLRWVERHLRPSVAFLIPASVPERIAKLCKAQEVLTVVFEDDLRVGPTGDFDRVTGTHVRTIKEEMAQKFPDRFPLLDRFDAIRARVRNRYLGRREYNSLHQAISDVLQALEQSYEEMFKAWKALNAVPVERQDIRWDCARALLERFMVKGQLEYWHWFQLQQKMMREIEGTGPMDRRGALGTSTPSKAFVF